MLHVFYQPLYETDDLRGLHLSLHVFIYLSTKPTPFGDSIFRCTTKDRGERRAKGLRPLESPGVNSDSKPDVLWLYHLATVRLTRLSRLRRSAYPLASACCAPKARLQHRRRKCPWGAGAQQERKIYATTRLPTSNQAGYSISVTNSPQLEQYNRVRGSSAKHATDGPKSR